MAPINGVFVNLETNPKKIIGFIVTAWMRSGFSLTINSKTLVNSQKDLRIPFEVRVSGLWNTSKSFLSLSKLLFDMSA